MERGTAQVYPKVNPRGSRLPAQEQVPASGSEGEQHFGLKPGRGQTL